MEKMVIRSRAPLRLGLAGGGTDVSPFVDIYGGCVLNATIDRYVYASLAPCAHDSVVFESGDMERSESLVPMASYRLDSGLVLHRAVYNYFVTKYNSGCPFSVYVHTYAEAPIGSGLGTSSTLVVALCAAFAEYFDAHLDDYDIAQLSWKIERENCGLAGGKQDQYAAVFGGINFIEFMKSGKVLVNPLRIKKYNLYEFESSLLLYFTGVSRESGNIIKQQSQNAEKHDEDALQAMKEIRQEAYAMKASLLTGDFPGLIQSFRKGWESKKRMAAGISNAAIETIYEAALAAGADAAKISGAGGGGFMMFLVSPARRAAVLRCLREFGGEVFPAHFTRTGAEVWRR